MRNHWTYKPFSPDDDLSQGDIIARTEPVLGILRDIHSYFCDPKYLCFIVLTQSCDLVMREGACKARQIGLGVVRALDDILNDTLVELCGTGVPGIYRKDARIAAQQFLERVLNQNEQANGLFYLHPDADVGIAVPAVAVLRVSISLRSREHYETLKQARCGCLDTEYRNKLGWLAGNLYSRVDTTDWADHDGGDRAAEKLMRELLDRTGTQEENVWVPDSWLDAARKQRLDLQALPRNRVFATLEPLAPPPPLATAIQRVEFYASKLLKELNEVQLQRFLDLVQADVVCPLLWAQVAFAASRALFSEHAGQLVVLLDRMPDDDRVRNSLVSQVRDAVALFKQHQGPRQAERLLEILRARPLFDAAAIAFACELAEESLGDAFAPLQDAFVRVLEAQLMDERIMARLHGLICQVLGEAVVERLSGRLQNDGQFKGSLRRT